MRKTTKLRNVLQMVALSAPPVLMALAGLLLRRRPKERPLAQKSKPADRQSPSSQALLQDNGPDDVLPKRR